MVVEASRGLAALYVAVLAQTQGAAEALDHPRGGLAASYQLLGESPHKSPGHRLLSAQAAEGGLVALAYGDGLLLLHAREHGDGFPQAAGRGSGTVGSVSECIHATIPPEPGSGTGV